MGEVITYYGEEAGLCGHDGSVWIKVTVDADGHLQVDGLSTALPTNAATATNQITMFTALQLIADLRNALGSVNTDDLQVDVKTTGNPSNLDIAISALRDALAGATPNTSTLYALNTLLTEIQARLGDETAPAAGTVNKQLADLLTELGQKLETADLNIEAGSKDLQVDVKSSALPTDAATQTTLALLLTELQQKLETADLASDTTRYINTLPFGYSGTAWQKQHLLWGYYDRWAQNLGGTKSGDGTYTSVTTAVPAGYVYVLQAVSIENSSGARGIAYACLIASGQFMYLACTPAPAQYVPTIFTGNVTLKAGDTVAIQQLLCLNGDVIYGGVWGYMMKVNM